MNFVKKDLTFLSSDGKNTIHATVFAPKDGEIKGVVQLSHGMIDYVGRYEALADYLTSKGYVLRETSISVTEEAPHPLRISGILAKSTAL